ncbi:MAG: hypothetical protein NTW25_02240 [Candidatus Kapabacteria bacterium]|nr:hypothetical protein [Candidatus Kapabacteria bacterium]
MNNQEIMSFLQRHWITACLISAVVALLKINNQIIDTILLISALELMAIVFSSFASFAFTKMKFTEESPIVLGFIFLGVHLLVGLACLGVYIAQFTN